MYVSTIFKTIRKLNQNVFRIIVPKIDQCGMKEKRVFEKRKNPGKKSLNEGTQTRLRKGPFIYYVKAKMGR